MNRIDRMGYTSSSDLRSSVNSAPFFRLKKDPSQEPNSSHPVYPVHPCLSSLRLIAFYLMNCARSASGVSLLTSFGSRSECRHVQTDPSCSMADRHGRSIVTRLWPLEGSRIVSAWTGLSASRRHPKGFGDKVHLGSEFGFSWNDSGLLGLRPSTV